MTVVELAMEQIQTLPEEDIRGGDRLHRLP